MRSTIELLLDELVASQQSLTRAVVKRDDERRRAQWPRRDTAVRAIVEYVNGLQAEIKTISDDRQRLAAEVMQTRLVVQLLRESVPMSVSEAEVKAGVCVRVPDTALRSFADTLADMLRNGHAQKLDGRIWITYPGLLAMARAKDTRDALDDLRTEHFKLERELRALKNPPATPEAKAS